MPRIPTRVAGHAAELSETAFELLHRTTNRIGVRDVSENKPSIASIVVIAIVLAFVFIIGTVLLIRIVRRFHPEPKYLPTPFLKRLWTDWKVSPSGTGHRYHLPDDPDADLSGAQGRSGNPTVEELGRSRGTNSAGQGTTSAAGGAGAGVTGGVDRNTSIRSVLTLPAYRPQPAETEQVLGREGERDGIDVVVEMPTVEDEEALRDEEMETLYQIRLARRRQIAEREERRQRRREARAQRDAVALQELQREARQASGSTTEEIEQLRQAHERIKETRQRAVSSVSYHEVGIARHDGTRIRANSTESERVGLLSDAASISLSTRSGSAAGLEGTVPSQHRRDRSASSVLSIDSVRSGNPASGSAQLVMSRSRTNSGANTPRAGSSPEIIDAGEGDLGDVDMPPHSPPGYDDVSLDDITPIPSIAGSSTSRANSPHNEPPPDYSSGPTQTRNHRLSAHMADLAAQATDSEDAAGQDVIPEQRQRQRSSRGLDGVPQLPSLRLTRLPQIVIEPSSAQPRDQEPSLMPSPDPSTR